MAKSDPTEPMRLKASQYPEVAKGTACTQASFKRGKKSFFFIGEQGGRYKAMFKLGPSREAFETLAKAHPDDYQIGSMAWATARFSSDSPLPQHLWEKWLDESYELSG